DDCAGGPQLVHLQSWSELGSTQRRHCGGAPANHDRVCLCPEVHYHGPHRRGRQGLISWKGVCPVNILSLLKQAAQIEANAVAGLVDQIDQSFVDAVELMRKCEGKVIVSGVGKSGLVGRKIAASLASTGTPAFFVHACE